MASNHGAVEPTSSELNRVITPQQSSTERKDQDIMAMQTSLEHQEYSKDVQLTNLEYTDDEHEPEIHFRTWLAVFAMCMLNYAALIAITGPPAMASLCNPL